MKLKVMAADDELLARQRLERLLTAMPEVDLRGVFPTGEALLAAVREDPPDLVLLDIQMPDLGGLELASLLDGACAVVFVTAHPEHAVRAFEVEALDYVLKPVEAARLKLALERARARVRPAGALATRLPVKTRQGLVLLDPAELTHASLEGELVTLHTEAHQYLSDWTLQALEQRLPERFLRVSRQALVNLDKVTVLEPQDSGGYLARLAGGALVQVSRQAARQLRRDLGLA